MGKGRIGIIALAVVAVAAAGGIGFWVGRGSAPAAVAPPAPARSADILPPKRGATGPKERISHREGYQGELDAARMAAGAKEFDRAVDMAERVFSDEKRPQHEWRAAVPVLCSILERAGRLDAYRLELEKPPLDTLEPRQLYLLAALQNAGHKTDRLETLAVLGKLTPDDGMVRIARLHTLLELGRRSEATREIEKLRAAGDPQYPRWALALGRAHAQSKDTAGLTTVARQVEGFAAKAKYPAPAWSIASTLHVLAGDTEAAVAAIDNWAKVLGDPENVERAGLLKARVFLDVGQKERAGRMVDEVEKKLKYRANREIAADLRRRMLTVSVPR